VKSVADYPAAWENSVIWGSKRHPTNPRCPMPMPIAHGKCIAIFFTRHLICARWPVRANIGSDSKTSCFRWTVQPSRCACRFFHGPSSVEPKVPSNFTCCWIMTGICRHLPIFPTARNMMSPSPVKCRCRRIRLLPWIEVTMIIGYLPYWTENQIYFVTRLKDNADYTVIEERRFLKTEISWPTN
jgi:hypothetical protein